MNNREVLGETVSEVTEDVARFVKAEIELAKAELVVTSRKVLYSGGFLGVAFLFMILGVVFVLGAIPEALAGNAGSSAGFWFLTGIFWFVMSAIFSAIGARKLKQALRVKEDFAHYLEEDKEWLRKLKKQS